tara:strand:- start:500 stop:742 length:243 start_codon:yes stop_codon:yes gene_type:complete
MTQQEELKLRFSDGNKFHVGYNGNFCFYGEPSDIGTFSRRKGGGYSFESTAGDLSGCVGTFKQVLDHIAGYVVFGKLNKL